MDVPRRVRGENRAKTTFFALFFALLTGGVAGSPIARFIPGLAMTQNHRSSYLKTTLLAAGAGALALLIAGVLAHWLPLFPASVLLILAGLAAALAWSVAAGGLLALYRDHRDQRSDVDLFRQLNGARSERALQAGGFDIGLLWGRLTRWLPGRPRFLVGDEVEVRSFEEIQRTLDGQGCVDALPFMPEMRRFCGERLRVFRRVDKIYDYGRTKGLRHVQDTYLLTGLRCNGSAHGGCQARCALMWKSAWLKRVSGRAKAAARADELGAEYARAQATSEPLATKYVCQFTELARASSPMSPWDVRQDLRPLLAGNVTVAGFLVVVLTNLFNAVQRWRRGVSYPPFAPGVLASTPAINHDLQAGDTVRVLGPLDIHRTLDKNNKNRGLWFDQDMLKHCGKDYHVLARVDRIIDNTNGAMRIMKSPCIVLEHVEYSGEALRFCPQEEHLYWREAWLTPRARGADSADTVQGRFTQRAANQF
jgi:hypothetical protein